MKKFLCVVLVVLLLIPTLLRGEEDADILVVTAPSGATLRETPDTKAAKLGRIPYLAEVKRTEWSDNHSTVEGVTACWFKVSWQGKEGWVFAALLGSNPREIELIKSSDGKVRREMHRLWLKTDDGKEVEFVDNPVSDKEYLNFTYYGTLPGNQFHVVMQSGWEWCTYLLVACSDGRQQQVDAVPVVSPDAARFVTANFDLEAGYGHNRLQIFRYENGMGVLEWSEEPTEWGPENPVWESDTRIKFNKKVLSGDFTEAFVEFDNKTSTWRLAD
ncbi:MAG: hypothetical protein GQF41_4246 [Candidatus Rifleibacterium amylolyticum]|nr:MAG: hypothetical protein GQF41_4246 [Candidatus Rifleibacterium amylolyticum]